MNEMEIIFLVLAIAGVFAFGALLVVALYPRTPFSLPRGYLGTKRKEMLDTSGAFRLLAPVLHFLAYNNSKIKLTALKDTLQQKLILAGNPMAMSPDEFLGFCELSAFSFGFLAYYFVSTVVGQASIPPILIMGAAGLFFPFMWLNGLVDRRTVQINRSLPYVMDLLILSMEAGLDFTGSVERIVQGGTKNDPLREELDTALREMMMGKTRQQALQAISTRVRAENLNTVIASIIQGEQLGTPLSKVLRIQAEMMRVKRTQNAEKVAGEAPVKMMFPLLLIFIAVFLILFGGTIVRGVRGQLF